MAVDPQWLKQTRMRNRQEFGMAGLGQGGQGAQDVVATLERVRAARTDRTLSERERAVALAAQQALASDPRTAALLALPKIEVPEARPIPRSVLIVGGLLAAGLLGVILWRSK